MEILPIDGILRAMKKINKSLFGICVGLALLNGAYAQEEDQVIHKLWSAIKVGDQQVSSNEVKEYIDSVLLSSEMHAQLFRQSKNDYLAYKTEKEIVLNSLFKDTVKQMAALRVIQAESMLGKSRRSFFNLTQEQMISALERNIRIAMAPFLQNGETKEEAKAAFVADLKSNGFPHEADASTDEVFSSWTKRLKTKMREDYRQKEATRYLCSIGNCQRSEPGAIFKQNLAMFASHNYLALRFEKDEELKRQAAFDSLLVKATLEEKEKTEAALSKIKSIFYIGKIVNEKVELIHINDWNLFGPAAEKLGYPDTDDYGRTSSFVLTYTQQGTEGNITVQLENWLFAEKLPKVDGMQQQAVEEESTIRIASRQFLDSKGDKWVIVGVSGTNRVQQAAVGVWIQENFHKLNSKSHPRNTVHRDGVDNFVQGLIGVGGKYSIIDTDHIDLVISGEGVLAPTIGQFSENSVTVRSALDLNIYGKRKELPIIQAGAFAEYRLKANGELETIFGGKVTTAIIINRLRYEAGLFVQRFDQELDRRYEGGPSWTMGIMLSLTLLPEEQALKYELN